MKNLPDDIDELIFYKKSKLALYNKIITFCSYFHIFSGIFLLVSVGLGRAALDFETGIIIILLSIPFFLIGYFAEYTSRKEIVFIIGWYIVIWLAYKNKITMSQIEWYVPFMTIGIILAFICAYFGNKQKQIEEIEIPIKALKSNRNGKMFRDINHYHCNGI